MSRLKQRALEEVRASEDEGVEHRELCDAIAAGEFYFTDKQLRRALEELAYEGRIEVIYRVLPRGR